TLVFIQPPTDTIAGGPFTPPNRVGAQDPLGNPVDSSSATVHIAIATNPTSTTLHGTLDVAFVGGDASFDDLHVDAPGTGYTFVATAADLTDATSAAFDVLAGDPVGTSSTITATPHSVPSDDVSTITIATRFVNAYGVPIPDLA